MANLTNFAENALQDHIFRGQALSLPASWHVALLTAAPGEAGGGTEVSAGGYARQAVARSLAAWAGTQAAGSTTASAGAGGETSNNAAITFGPFAGATGSITHFALFDAATGGNMWFHGALDAARSYASGESAPFAPGALRITAA